MALVVAVGLTQKRDPLGPLEKQVQLARDMDITLSPYTRYGISYQTNPIKAGAFEIRALASVINYVLCGAVFLLRAAPGKWRQFRRLSQIDINECARVIALLCAAGRRQSFEAIVEQLPGLNPVKTFDDLRYVEGVLFLSAEPWGLALSPELRDELDRRCGG